MTYEIYRRVRLYRALNETDSFGSQPINYDSRRNHEPMDQADGFATTGLDDLLTEPSRTPTNNDRD